MNVEINVEGLIKNKLTASQYVMLVMLYESNTELFVNYINLYGFAKKELQGLVDQGYILSCDPNNPLTCITIARDKVRKLLGVEESYFTELFNTYPIKVSNGSSLRILRPSSLSAKAAKVCKEKYDRFIKGNVLKHKHVMECLNKELDIRRRGGNLQFMHALETYINKNAWDQYEGLLVENNTIQSADTKYGEDLI
ncbi:MAG: hypothetical protein Unbinned838contig1000_60 [Prokaryotic dsDNA virus sp.]|nr:MAG: hypothetical protein Unbinned838contig1000_60 [Prokaryotic dsDNA virus sp.]|tara:strand:- start:47073 stop:47660 length:588 start_codon:yes stop_codon:yes gene_type:complete